MAVVYHFTMRVYNPDIGGGQGNTKSQWGRVLDPDAYQPTRLDTDQWLAAARDLDARYAYFTPTHMNGFLQWQSDLYPYGVKQSSWRSGKGDVVQDFVHACRRHDIEPCLFFGTRFNAYWGVSQHLVDWGLGEDRYRQRRYVEMCEGMLTELCSRYGPLAAVWFDGGVLTPGEGGPDAQGIVEHYQPDAEFYHSLDRADHRWIGNEQGYAGYPCWATVPSVEDWGDLAHGDPEGKHWAPGMVDVPLRNHDWFWAPDREHVIYPLDALVEMYCNSVGRNCTLILGVTPDPEGLLPEPDVERMREFDAEIRRRFGKPLARTAGNGPTLRLPLERPTKIDHVNIMEDIIHGERIREYVVEGLLGAGNWVPLCDGTSVGHKRIQQFESVTVADVRLRVTQSVAEPRVRDFAVYDVG